MKTLSTLLICVVALAGTVVITPAAAQPGFRTNISFNTFYNELSPYGRWMNMPRYGQVWIYNEPGFRPYATNGQWEYTELGWTWISDYNWGWGPFHYGRWELDPFYGWFWIPGYDYAPAWVVWSQADDYYGWAPLGFGVDINVSIGRIPRNRWMYAPRNYISHRRIDRYCIPYERNQRYYGRQQPVVNVYVNNNVRYSRGPEYRGRGYNRDGYYNDRNTRNNRNGNGRNSYRNNDDNVGYPRQAAPGSRPDRREPSQTPEQRPEISQRNGSGFEQYERKQQVVPENRVPIVTNRPENQRPAQQPRVMERPRPATNNTPRQLERRIENSKGPVHLKAPENKKVRVISR